MNTPRSIIVVIPVYNHAATLADVVKGVLSCGHRALVIDDGSTDNCLQKIKHLDCITLRHEKNLGKGAAILTGAEKAASMGFSAIITIDADGQHNPLDIKTIADEYNRQFPPVLIIGARRMVENSVPKSSHFGKHFSNFWVRLECGYDLPDTQSGFRLYPVTELLQLKLTRSRYDFEIESIVKLAWAGVKITSVPVSVHYPPGNKRISHFHKIKDNCRLTLLHSQLVLRRLLPLPHKKLIRDKPLQQKILASLHRNPLKTLAKICKEHSSPFWLAIAVWLGLFMGALPLLACHTIAIIYVAHRLHINKVAAVAASQFCMPPVVPVICIEAGYFLRNGHFLVDLSWQRWLLEIHQRLYEWFIGSLVVGPIIGGIGGLLMYWTAVRIQTGRRLNSNKSL